jgi:hypothetical protein
VQAVAIGWQPLRPLLNAAPHRNHSARLPRGSQPKIKLSHNSPEQHRNLTDSCRLHSRRVDSSSTRARCSAVRCRLIRRHGPDPGTASRGKVPSISRRNTSRWDTPNSSARAVAASCRSWGSRIGSGCVSGPRVRPAPSRRPPRRSLPHSRGSSMPGSQHAPLPRSSASCSVGGGLGEAVAGDPCRRRARHTRNRARRSAASRRLPLSSRIAARSSHASRSSPVSQVAEAAVGPRASMSRTNGAQSSRQRSTLPWQGWISRPQAKQGNVGAEP